MSLQKLDSVGLPGASQGLAYRVSPTVCAAEFVFGGVLGALLAATLLMN